MRLMIYMTIMPKESQANSNFLLPIDTAHLLISKPCNWSHLPFFVIVPKAFGIRNPSDLFESTKKDSRQAGMTNSGESSQ